MANYEATRYDYDGGNITGLVGIPTATIIPWSSSSVPTGYLECNGANVSRSTYATLFAEIGTTYGAGDGSSTFGLPNLQDNVALGKSGTKALASTGGANATANSGNIGGSTANATLSTAQLASHSHDGFQLGILDSMSTQYWQRFSSQQRFPSTNSTGSGGGHSHNMSATFTGDSTSVVQPYLTIIYIIKT
jgi:microcystin-dependent protein